MTTNRVADAAVAIQEWLVAALSASQELADGLGCVLSEVPNRLWDFTPDPDALVPFVQFTVPEPRDVGGVGMADVWAESLVQVKVVARAEAYDPIRLAAVALHHTLHGQVNVPLANGGTMLSSRRFAQISYPETQGGIQYRHLGGIFQVTVQ